MENKWLKHLLMTALFLVGSLQMVAQGPPPRFNPQKFQAELEQFITTEAGLTPLEAARFFPLYREMQNKQRLLFGKMRMFEHTDTGDNKASLKAIKELDKIDLEMKKIQQEYHLKFCKVLPPGKVLSVIKADEKFHRICFRRMARRK